MPRSAAALVAFAAAAALALAPRPAAAAAAGDAGEGAGQACLGEARTRWLASGALFTQTPPQALDAQLQLGICTPLLRAPGPLFDRTNLQAGVKLEATPVYVLPGAFVSVAPLSILELRADVAPIQTWTIGLDAAGYFPRTSRDQPYRHLPASQARSASGWTATLGGTLQGEVALAPGWTVAAVDSLALSYWDLGHARWYYNPAFDLLTARRDWVGKNMAFLLLGRKLSPAITARVGPNYELTWSARGADRHDVLGLAATADLAGWPRRGDVLSPFLRLGWYTAHAFRTGPQVLAGVSVAMGVGGGGR